MQVIKLNEYHMCSLKIHKLINNNAIIKNYTIFNKGKIMQNSNISSEIRIPNLKQPKTGVKNEI